VSSMNGSPLRRRTVSTLQSGLERRADLQLIWVRNSLIDVVLPT